PAPVKCRKEPTRFVAHAGGYAQKPLDSSLDRKFSGWPGCGRVKVAIAQTHAGHHHRGARTAVRPRRPCWQSPKGPNVTGKRVNWGMSAQTQTKSNARRA